MRILAIDTTTELCALAIHADGVLAAECVSQSAAGFDHLLFPAIDNVLQAANLHLNEIDAFAAAIGPGSFTGVRVGLTAAKGLAEALGKPVVGISNLRSLATYGSAKNRATLLDARRQEVYAAVYNDELDAVVQETVGDLTAWLEALNISELEFVCQAGNPYIPDVQSSRYSKATITVAPRNGAIGVASCALVDLIRGHRQDILSLDANYVRRSDTKQIWRDLNAR